jgi:hypothetical protein
LKRKGKKNEAKKQKPLAVEINILVQKVARAVAEYGFLVSFAVVL